MGNLLKNLLESLADGFLKRIITGAGLSLITGVSMMVIINFLFDKFLSDFFVVGDLAALVGVGGLDQCISIVMSAVIARAMLSSGSVSVSKAS